MTQSPFGLHRTPPPRKRRGWVLALGLVGVILVGNAVVFYFYKRTQERPFAGEIIASVEDRTELPVVGGTPREARVEQEGGLPAVVDPSIRGRAEEQRAKGIELLRGGEYAAALAALEGARSIHRDLENIDDLIEVARKLQRGNRRPPPPSAGQDSGTTRRSSGSSGSSRSNRRSERRRSRSSSPPSATEPAVILVTTKPERLVVRIDGDVRDMTPARIEVEPGRHRVEVFDGDQPLLSETVSVRSGEVELINRIFERPPTPVAETPPKDAADSPALSKDRELNLVELLDRGEVAPTPSGAPVAARAADGPSRPARTEQTVASPRSGSPRVLLYYPGRNANRVRAELAQGLSGIEVALVGSESRLRRELASGADAVVASSFVLRGMGLAPSLVAEGGGDYALASFTQGMTPGQAAAGTVAVVDELGRKGTPPFVARILGVSDPPLVRRVTKVEDLLTLLQLGQADAIVVRPRHLTTLRGRTRRTLHSIGLRAPAVALAVAFVDGGRRTTIEPRIRNLPGEARAELGITRWASR